MIHNLKILVAGMIVFAIMISVEVLLLRYFGADVKPTAMIVFCIFLYHSFFHNKETK